MTQPLSTAPSFLIRALGTAELCELDAEGHVMPRLLGPGKPLALLAFCSCARDREHSRDFLAELLWDDSDPARSRQSLRQALWRLRRLMGDRLRTREDAVVGLDHTVVTDREQFLSAVHRGDASAAIKLYGGPFLSGLTVPGGDQFDDWAAIERRHLEESLLRVVEPHARAVARSGRPAQAREIVERLTQQAPDNLDAHRIAVEVLLEANDRAAARRAADGLESLARGLGGRAPSVTDALVARARDDNTATGSERVASVMLDLVGREDAFATIMAAWTRARAGDTQIVVLSGVAGIGKSRLLAAISQRCASRRSLAASVRANSGERDVPFGFVAAIARALATVPGAAGISAESARELVALDPGLGSHFAVAPSTEDGGESVRRRALAILDLLNAIVEQEPLALLLDDLHWVDAASRQLLTIVFGRTETLPLLVVATTRGTSASIFDQRAVITVPLLPLAADDVVDAIRSSGTWPESRQAVQFIDVLARSCEGIPLSVMERLSLVRDSGMLQLVDGAWSSSQWEEALAEVAVASPLDHRLSACTVVERQVLLALAVAGTPLTEPLVTEVVQVLSSGASAATPQSARAALEALEVKGLVLRTADAWLPHHDVVTERMLALSAVDDRRRCHLSLARAFSTSDEPQGPARAVRHYLLADDALRAGTELTRVVARARQLGDRRPAREMLIELVGERLPASLVAMTVRRVPLWYRAAPIRGRIIAAVASLIVLVTVAFAWCTVRKPAFVVTQSASVSSAVPGLSEDIRRTTPSIILSSSGASGDRLIDGTYIHVFAADPRTTILVGDSARVTDGLASFNTLRFRSTDAQSMLRFEAPGLRSVTLPITRSEARPVTPGSSPMNLRAAGGILNGAPIDVRSPLVRVSVGGGIDGFLQIEYTAPWPAASVWLSTTPTWGNPKERGRELTPLTTPVQREIVDVQVSERAPATAGHYWLLYVIDAEPSGMFTLSRTNWSVGHAVWDDGNEIATLPDSTIRRANVDGYAKTFVAFSSTWPKVDESCRAVTVGSGAGTLKQCVHFVALFGIEVIVTP